MTPYGKIAPHDLAAERSVLGALLINPLHLADVVELLKTDDFYDRRHRLIYEQMVDLAERNQPVDAITVGTALKSNEALAASGGDGYLVDLISVVPNAAHLMHHARLVNHTSLLRTLIDSCTDIISRSYGTHPDEESVTQLLDEAENRIFKINSSKDSGGAVEVGGLLADAFKLLEAQRTRGDLTGLPSGFLDLDEMLGGFNPGELTVIAARPAMGKTAFALNLIEHAATHRPAHFDHDPAILFFSLEMGRLSIVQRMLSSRARVDSHKMRTGRVDPAAFADLTHAAGDLQKTRLFLDDTPGLTIMSVRSRARRLKHQSGLDMIVLDYLQLMNAKAENRQQEISLISRSLKDLARELEVPILALSQLSRSVESREDKRPMLSDLRESGSIEQDADVVLMLYRAEYYNPTEENKGQAEVICAKHRNGPTGKVKLQFTGNILRFQNPAPSIAEPISL
ncbi:MAG TPA: replicative DNA helicase [Planctomycetes bacterium]|nr:replicative DNA helicase [Planctomycetota bacterium]HIK61501.1 replicative DNA helicase [Planctomycetota bacterium]